MASIPPTTSSPRWSSTTKLLVGLTFIGLLVALVINFRAIIGPLLLAFVLAYLLHPIVARVSQITRLSWRMSANLIYLILVILLITFTTLAGLAIVQQLQSLIRVIQDFIEHTLPDLITQLSTQEYTFGPLPFTLSLNQFDLQALTDQVLGILQPLLGRAGTVVSTLATSAATTIGWGIFVLLVAYFLLADAGQVQLTLVDIEIPGYDTDLRRLGNHLRHIWNAFLRGQLLIIILVIVSYTLLLTILGIRYAVGIAILAGLARFVPYVGPFVTWTVTVLVALFQGSNYFGLQPIQYTLLVVALAVIVDQIFDNYVSPRIFGQTLGVHPAAVLVAAIIAANLIGIIGLVLAAPVLATLTLLGRYTLRKMLDLDPWPLAEEEEMRQAEFPGSRLYNRLRQRFKTLLEQIQQRKNSAR